MRLLEWVASRQHFRVQKASGEWSMSDGLNADLYRANLRRKRRYEALCKIIDSRR